MHAPTMTALEFTRIQEELAASCASQMGKELAMAVQPVEGIPQIRKVQQETTEAREMLTQGRAIPFGGIQDVRRAVDRSLNGGVLRPDELTAVADTVYGCRQLHRFLTENQSQAVLLSRHADAFGRFDGIEEEIRRCIERGTVSSRASRALKQTRSEIATLEGRIQDRLNGLLRQYRQHLQEALITTRNAHYVLPVKAGSRASVPGTVHGSSASGSTLFIEPTAISQLSDELETWRAMETAEIEQVLMSLSGQVAQHADRLKATLAAVAELDLIFARARLSLSWDARPVEWNESGEVDLKGARHPLLGRSAVGNRIRMTANSRMLIVTGPNTGGKTLLLKTLGLLVIAARCGLHLPVDEGSTLCYFADVRADIGDHQSLEQSLSTFSGHIATIAPMLMSAGPDTLILLDELGSGTDPHEGTGLGIAVLEAFLQLGAYTLVTTHLRDIKEFGRTTPGCAFAGMGFDGETLRPTYRLLYGALGESRGLDIAERAGLPPAVVARARHLVYGQDQTVPCPTAPVQPAVAAERSPVPFAQVSYEEAPEEVQPEPAQPKPAHAVVVAALSPTRCRIWHDGRERELTVPDHVRRSMPDGLVVGDSFRMRDGQMAEVERRQTVLISRDADTMAETVVAANATRLLILMPARQPDFHATVLARHLFYAERQGIPPIICLTKADLVSPKAAEDWLKPFQRSGYQTVVVSGLRKHGVEELSSLLAGERTAVMGLPRSGKSTLLAALGANEEQAGGKGAKAEPHAIFLSAETWLLDVPGLRELGVWKPDLADGLREFGPFLGKCRRPGCLHGQEPGCAVREAVERGTLERRRYDQYRYLLHQMRLA